MSLLSVFKGECYNKLISWLRSQNAFLPEPPSKSLLNPNFFFAICSRGPAILLSPVYFYTQNMFHNIILLESLALLFLLPTFKSQQLTIRSNSICSTPSGCATRPHSSLSAWEEVQLLSGKWYVYIAQIFAAGCISQAHDNLRSSRLSHGTRGPQNCLLRKHSQFYLNCACPLFMRIIDNITIAVCRWYDRTISLLQRILLKQNLSVTASKYFAVGTAQSKVLRFIGFHGIFYRGYSDIPCRRCHGNCLTSTLQQTSFLPPSYAKFSYSRSYM